MTASSDTTHNVPENTPIPRLGFAGLGWIGAKRMRSLLEAGAAEAYAIYDPSPVAVNGALQDAPRAAVCHSFADLLEHSPDGVVIATPSALHSEQTLAALARGKAVFCQKPLGRSAAEVHAMISMARQQDKFLGVDLSYRHVEGLARIQHLIQSGELGKVFAMDLCFHNAYGPDKPWFYQKSLSGGGCVIDLGIHLVDLAVWMADARVQKVTGKVFCHGEAEVPDDQVEDYAVAQIQFDGGAVANVACSWRSHAGAEAVIGVTVHGANGGAIWRNVDGSFVHFRTWRCLGTQKEVISDPGQDWGGCAALAWANRLRTSAGFDPEILRQIQVAEVLDCILKQEEI